VADGTYVRLLGLICGGLLLSGVLILWRRQMSAIVGLLAAQGALIAALAAVLGLEQEEPELCVVAVFVFALKAVIVPVMLRRTIARTGAAREADPLVNVTASLVAAALLTLLAYAVCRPLVALDPSPATDALPVGLALVFLGVFTLVTRRTAISQIFGFLMLDNGIAVIAFLATSGVPFIVELGASLDLFLVILVLQVLSARMRLTFGHTDLDDLRELRG
jgi:hydrogenase-4 component E